MELWDLLDIHRRPLGRTHPRGRQYPMPKGTYHTVVMIFTVDSRRRVLLTKRAPTKGLYPDYWEITGGSGVAGEDSLTSACRELKEETGLTAGTDELILLGTVTEPSAFVDCYLYRPGTAGDILHIALQEGETVDYRWETFYRLDSMVQEGTIPPPVAMRYGYVREALMSLVGATGWTEEGVLPEPKETQKTEENLPVDD